MDAFTLYAALVPYMFVASVISLTVLFLWIAVRLLGSTWGIVVGFLPAVIIAWFVSFAVALAWPMIIFAPVAIFLARPRRRGGYTVYAPHRAEKRTYR